MAFIREASGPAAADAFVERVRTACAWLAELPRSGKACSHLRARLRRFPVAGYTVFFRPMGYGVEVNRLLHQRRDEKAEFARGRRSPRGKPAHPGSASTTPADVSPPLAADRIARP